MSVQFSHVPAGMDAAAVPSFRSAPFGAPGCASASVPAWTTRFVASSARRTTRISPAPSFTAPPASASAATERHGSRRAGVSIV